jgi:hypothetical protein
MSAALLRLTMGTPARIAPACSRGQLQPLERIRKARVASRYHP